MGNVSPINLSAHRHYSTEESVVPVKIYSNADLSKESIITENKGKSGIYLWVNLKNSEAYIGSSVNLGVRLRKYYSHYYLTKGSKGMYISRALLKYGYSGFNLEILEYCAPEKCLEREQYYIDLLNPEYNVLLTAGSPVGRKHTEEARKLMSEAKKGNRNATGHIVSEEARIRMSDAKKGWERPVGAGRQSVQIEVLDLETGITKHYPSLRDVSRDIDVHAGSISNYLSSPSGNNSSSKSKKPYKGRYIFKNN